MRNTYDQADVGRMLDQMVAAIAAEFEPGEPLNIVGILTRGETIAARVAQGLGQRGYVNIRRGVLDITLYRDDLSEIGPLPLVRPTTLDVPLDANPCVLVDDVVFTGRSVRAALNLLNDFGRPRVIRLAVLVDRVGRELPIQPDYVGLTLKVVPPDYRVKVRLKENDGFDEIVVEPRNGR
ncbi:MAG TPA: bifunctional pyr operon transcriptional regulator/uracil phosphoribosyltransferase PyrR [Tepidisphaeraceae bacterium]|jgi:pyrimidine operon attenuation protein/uracil phosphoribosyltransferase|nr:bifunctional pyr operon transcriptional regulator/uracil phosphoribosyltransferase PyrR [Tepidisphaeraceae bacterium]